MNSDIMREVDEAEKRFLSDRARYTEYLNREFAKRDAKSQLISAHNDGKIEGIEIGRKQGKEEGKLEGKKETLHNMIKDNLSFDLISRYLDLSIDEIHALLKD